MADVILVAGSTPVPALDEALAARGFEPQFASVEGIADSLFANGARAIALCIPSDAGLAKTVAEVAKLPAVATVPVVVVLSASDSALRDQCLIAGAHDVSPSGHPDDVAARIDGAVHGWIRAEPKRAIRAVFKAQRGKQVHELKVVDIDATGFTMAAVEGLSDGHLLRVTLGLPDGALVAWGRVATADGVPGVRLVALAPEDRTRIVNAVKGKSAAAKTGDAKPVSNAAVITASMRAVTAPPAAPSATTSDSTGATASMRAQPRPEPQLPAPSVIVSPPPEVPPGPAAPARTVSADSVPPAMRPRSNPPRTSTRPASAHPTPVMVTRSSAPVAAPAKPNLGQTVSMRAITNAPMPKVDAAPAPAIIPPAPPAPVVTAPPVANKSISDAIGDMLGDAPAAEPGPAEAAVPEQISDVRLWPGSVFETASALAVLREAVVRGITAEAIGAPPPVATVGFVRTMTPQEKHAFDAQPPADLPDPPLAANALAVRLRLFALTEEARKATAELATGATFLIDDEAIAKLAADVNSGSAELQRVMDGLMVAGQPQRMKQINAFRNTVTKAHSDLKSAIDQLRGQQALQGGVAMLDATVQAPEAPKPEPVRVRSEAPKAEAKPEVKNEYAPKKDDSIAAKERKRIIYGSILFVVLAVVAVILFPRKPAVLNATDLGALPDIVKGQINGRPPKAIFTANNNWVADDRHLKPIESFEASHGIKAFTVVTDKFALLVASVPGKEMTVLPMAKAPRPVKQ